MKCAKCERAERIRMHLNEDPETYKWCSRLAPSAPGGQLEHLVDSQSAELFCMRFHNELRWVQAWIELEADDDDISGEEDDDGGPHNGNGQGGNGHGNGAEPPERVVYLAHPVSGDFAANIARASKWLDWANNLTAEQIRQYGLPVARYHVIAPWLAEAKDIDHIPGVRAALLARCLAVVRRCDELWVAGPMSAGVRAECDAAIKAGLFVRDLVLHVPAAAQPVSPAYCAGALTA